MTDGFLVEIILTTLQQKTKAFPYDVVMLDEVHERGQNIDLCIALLSLLLEDPQ